MVRDSFLGTVRRSDFVTAEGRPGYIVRSCAPRDYPEADDEYFEWIDLLQAVATADCTFTFVELGAGYGRWSMRAAAAARQVGIGHVRLIAVEADPTHFRWLRCNFEDNSLDASQHRLVHRAVDSSAGRGRFTVAEPDVDPADSAGLWYGQAIYRRSGSLLRRATTWAMDTALLAVSAGSIDGIRVSRTAHGWRTVQIGRVRLDDLLHGEGLIDLIDCDIQGAELRVLSAGIGALDRAVRRLHVATHSRAVEKGIGTLLAARGWRCEADYPCGQAHETAFGRIVFQDGVQSWLNPRLW
jgi:FkbM family methyltransferase